MGLPRRSLLGSALATLVAASLVEWPDAQAQRPVRRRRVRRRIRRRHRRVVVRRTIRGRPFWVVPVGLAVGWELVHDNRVVIVRETRIVERDGERVEVLTVADADGKVEEVEVVREDNDDNRRELEGSRLSDAEQDVPSVESDIEEDE